MKLIPFGIQSIATGVVVWIIIFASSRRMHNKTGSSSSNEVHEKGEISVEPLYAQGVFWARFGISCRGSKLSASFVISTSLGTVR